MSSYIRCGGDDDPTGPSDDVPVLTTVEVSAITETSAQGGGTITANGGASITARGVCWSTGTTPAVADKKTVDGAGTGSFSSSITGLTGDVAYYVRAYATNSVGTGYGNTISFTTATATQTPTVSTVSVSAITQTTAQSGGNITANGGGSVTASGICWSTNTTPTVVDSKTVDGVGMGTFVSSLTGLTAGTLYYVRAYATNSIGTGYGSILMFTTSSGTVTDIDGNLYQTVTIGTQVWMMENLKVTHYRNGDPITHVTDDITWRYGTAEAYCEYYNEPSNVTTYGLLYNFWAILDNRNIAPEGWHVPTDDDWKQLEMYLGMSQATADSAHLRRGTDEGGKLMETGATHWWDPIAGVTNESGFTALPGGRRQGWGDFIGMKLSAHFWSSTKNGVSSLWYRALDRNYLSITRWYADKLSRNGLSVRCIKD